MCTGWWIGGGEVIRGIVHNSKFIVSVRSKFVGGLVKSYTTDILLIVLGTVQLELNANGAQ